MRVRIFLAGVAIAIVYGSIGHADYTEAKKTEARYCANVKSKLWPDYQKNFNDICKKDVDTNNG